jgi:hypothetical protein
MRSNSSRRRHQQLHARQLLLESLEDRRVMTVSGSTDFTQPFLIDPLPSVGGYEVLNLSNTSTTLSAQVEIDVSGQTVAYRIGTPQLIGFSGSASTMITVNNSDTEYTYTFDVPANTSSGKFIVPIAPKGGDGIPDAPIAIGGSIETSAPGDLVLFNSGFDIFGTTFQTRSISICPACGCCQGNVQGGWSSQQVHSAAAIASNGANSANIAGIAAVDMQNISSRTLANQFVIDVPLAGGSADLLTRFKLHSYFGAQWDEVLGDDGFFTNASDSSSVRDYRLSLKAPQTYTVPPAVTLAA